jgi:uncharacterized YccA/Bax inhibitor family protein
MRSGNPILKDSTFKPPLDASAERMSLTGTVNKTAMLLALALITAVYTWGRFMETRDLASIYPLLLVGGVGGFIAALVTVFRQTAAPYTAPAYAVLEGFVLGGLSATLEVQFPGIVIQAVGLTFGTLFCLLAAYRSGLIKATENFKLGVVAATGGIALVYLIGFVMSFFGAGIPLIHGSGPIGIVFSVIVVGVAALNLVLDFDFIEHGAERGAPKYMEWYGAFGLLVTLVWLYLEILRLLAKLQERR